jgi:hypothetical protein
MLIPYSVEDIRNASGKTIRFLQKLDYSQTPQHIMYASILNFSLGICDFSLLGRKTRAQNI